MKKVIFVLILLASQNSVAKSTAGEVCLYSSPVAIAMTCSFGLPALVAGVAMLSYGVYDQCGGSCFSRKNSN